MRIVVAGSSGLIGNALVTSLHADGHEVTRLVRRRPSSPDESQWDPGRGQLDDEVLRGTDAVVNLCGAGIGDKRWSGERLSSMAGKSASRANSVAPPAATAARMCIQRSATSSQLILSMTYRWVRG